MRNIGVGGIGMRKCRIPARTSGNQASEWWIPPEASGWLQTHNQAEVSDV